MATSSQCEGRERVATAQTEQLPRKMERGSRVRTELNQKQAGKRKVALAAAAAAGAHSQ